VWWRQPHTVVGQRDGTVSDIVAKPRCSNTRNECVAILTFCRSVVLPFWRNGRTAERQYYERSESTREPRHTTSRARLRGNRELRGDRESEGTETYYEQSEILRGDRHTTSSARLRRRRPTSFGRKKEGAVRGSGGPLARLEVREAVGAPRRGENTSKACVSLTSRAPPAIADFQAFQGLRDPDKSLARLRRACGAALA